MLFDVQSYQLRNDGIYRALGYQEEDSFPARMTADSSPKTNTGVLCHHLQQPSAGCGVEGTQ